MGRCRFIIIRDAAVFLPTKAMVWVIVFVIAAIALIPIIVLTSESKTLVIGMRDANDTKAIYDTISEKLGG